MAGRYPLAAFATLGLIGVASGAQYLSAEQAQQILYPAATRFESKTVVLSNVQLAQVQHLSGLPARSAQWQLISAYQDNQLLGYVVIDDVKGKYELISYAVSLGVEGLIQQVEILAYRESHGQEIRNAAWRKQFSGKTLASGLHCGDDIANISGATLSCTHVTDGIRRIAAVVQVSQSSPR